MGSFNINKARSQCEKYSNSKVLAKRKISPRFTVADWERITFTNCEDWKNAVEIFRDRVNGYMFDLIAKTTRHRNSQLAVLLLDCAVIEMLQQFRSPAPQPGTRSRHPSQAAVVKLLSRPPFNLRKNLSEMFYKQVRCGLAHRYEITFTSFVVDDETAPLLTFTENRLGVIVNKKKMHTVLQLAFQQYIDCLIDTNKPEHDELRRHFRSNMNWICGVTI